MLLFLLLALLVLLAGTAGTVTTSIAAALRRGRYLQQIRFPPQGLLLYLIVGVLLATVTPWSFPPASTMKPRAQASSSDGSGELRHSLVFPAAQKTEGARLEGSG